VKRLIKAAYKEALKGRHPSQKVGAVLYRGGCILARASNMSRPYGLDNRGFHAEERLLNKYPKEKIPGATVVVVRTNLKGCMSSMSRPCTVCYNLLVENGIRKIVYVDWKNEISIEKM